MSDPPASLASLAPTGSHVRRLAEARAPRSETAGLSGSSLGARQTGLSVLLIASVATALGACGSTASTPPPRYGYVFVTSKLFYGNQFSTSGGDGLCNTVAAGTIPGMTPRFGSDVRRISKWVAWLSYYDSMFDKDMLGGALARLQVHLGYPTDVNSWVDWHDTRWDGTGTPIFSNFIAIPAGPAQAYGGIHFDESGRDLSNDPIPQVWTATGSDGFLTASYDSCLEVKSDQNGDVVSTKSWANEAGTGRVGLLTKWGTDWTYTNQTIPCSKQAHLYCFGLVQ